MVLILLRSVPIRKKVSHLVLHSLVQKGAGSCGHMREGPGTAIKNSHALLPVLMRMSDLWDVYEIKHGMIMIITEIQTSFFSRMSDCEHNLRVVCIFDRTSRKL